MKKSKMFVFSAALMLALSGCGSSVTSTGTAATEQSSSASQSQTVTIKQSPDKYTWYVKNYVGMNANAIGYTALNGQRMDQYGSGYVKIVFVTKDGAHIKLDDEESLKQYKVSAQSVEPNTEIKYTFETNSEGEEYDNLVDHQNLEEIVLSMDKVGENGNTADNTAITLSPDKYTEYVRDYVGRNLADCGYVSMGGFYVDSYGAGYVKFNIVTDDGSAVDLEKEDSLANYVVTSQDVEANTAITIELSKDSEGNEYSNLVDHQSIENITLYVSALSAE